MQKQGIELEDNEQTKDFSVTPITLNFFKPRIRTSSSCRVIVRLPSVEPDVKILKIREKPLRPSSAPRVSRKSGVGVKNDEGKKWEKNGKCRNWLDSYKGFNSVFGIHIQNAIPLPDLRVMEFKRASLRLRKLKRVAVKNNKENSLNN